MDLPPSLRLSPHLSAHKYFYVCTLTVAAWDTLVLSPRTWTLFRKPGWPVLKIIFHFLRFFMPIEFLIAGIAFFDTKWSQARCRHFYLFEPIATAILLAATSAIHVIRVHAIYNKSKHVLYGLSGLLAAQIIATAVASGFYRSVPLDVGQGCIAGPKAAWVGIYWVFPTLFYVTTFALALNRSIKSLQVKQISLWKLMLRDGLNLYGTIALVQVVNVLFWFIAKPTGPEDTIKTIVTSMAAVLTTSMSLRIVLVIRGELTGGGTFAGSSVAASSHRSTRGTSGSGRSAGHIGTNANAPTYTLDEMRTETAQVKEGDWYDSADTDCKASEGGGDGVKITVDREVEYDSHPYGKGV